MSALALPLPARRGRDLPRPARHLRLVQPGFVPTPQETPAGQPPCTAQPVARPAIRLTARGRLLRSVLGLLLATGMAVAGGSWLGGTLAGESYTGPVERVSVTAGDTLWAIAAASAAEGQDVREQVEDILQLNGMASGELAVGQQLVVPAG